MLCTQAREVATAFGVSQDTFTTSWSWRQRYQEQHRLSLRRRTRVGLKTPDDALQIARAFADTVQRTIEAHACVTVFNADQTAVNYEYLPSQTINSKGDRTVWVRNSGAEKTRLTAMLAADAEGNKLAPFAVLKQRPSSVLAACTLNDEKQNGFGRGMWRQVTELMR